MINQCFQFRCFQWKNDPVFKCTKKTSRVKKQERQHHETNLINTINRVFWAGLGCWSTYNLVDIAFAHGLCLQTLVQGTGPLGYLGMNIYGADPNFGAHAIGTARGTKFEENSIGHVCLLKDSEQPIYCGNGYRPLCDFYTAYTARHFAAISGINTAKYLFGPKLEKIGLILGFITPNVKFRFIPEEILECGNDCRFEDDPLFGGHAYRTKEKITTSHLGITGSLYQGIDSQTWSRMEANPEKVLLGIHLLAVAVLVGQVTYYYIKYPKIQTPHSVSNHSFSHCINNTILLVRILYYSIIALAIIFLNTL